MDDRRFAGFDGLRGVAILAILAWHGAFAVGYRVNALMPIKPFVLAGWLGVDLFFALSGFLITSLILREEAASAAGSEGRPGFSLARFYLRRALRILPIFYVVFLIEAFVLARFPLFVSVNGAAMERAGSALGLLPYALFLGNYAFAYGSSWFDVQVAPGNAFVVFWSLCVEEHFYLLWPLFLTFVRGARARVAAGLLTCASILGLRVWGLGAGWRPEHAFHIVSHYRIDSLLWGGLGAIAFAYGRAARDRWRRLALGAQAAVGGCLLVAGFFSGVPKPMKVAMGWGLTFVAVGATLLLLELAHRPASVLARALEVRPLVWLGRLSYAIYLIHFPVMDVGRQIFFAAGYPAGVLGYLIALGLFTLLAVAVALPLHFLIERPFLRLKSRFGARATSRLRTAEAPAPP